MELRSSNKGARTSKVITRSLSRYDTKTRENAESPLLRLPLELKTKIYEYVCGGQTVHIDWRQPRFYHHLCKTSLSEEEAQKQFDACDASEEDWYAFATIDHHLRCCTDTTSHYECLHCGSLHGRFKCQAKSDMRLLLCCRQVYLESNAVLYYANTFSFSSADALSKFCCLIRKRYKPMIRSLHVRLIACGSGLYVEQDWHKAFGSVAKSLIGLRRLHITMELVPSERGAVTSGQVLAVESILSDILQVGKLGLKSATVVLSDSHFMHDYAEFYTDEREMDERWTLTQKQEWSRYLRYALLHYEDRELELARVKQEALEQGRVCRL